MLIQYMYQICIYFKQHPHLSFAVPCSIHMTVTFNLTRHIFLRFSFTHLILPSPLFIDFVHNIYMCVQNCTSYLNHQPTYVQRTRLPFESTIKTGALFWDWNSTANLIHRTIATKTTKTTTCMWKYKNRSHHRHRSVVLSWNVW